MTLLTTAVDKSISKSLHIIPGMGNFGDRYYGTEASGCSLRPTHLRSLPALGDTDGRSLSDD